MTALSPTMTPPAPARSQASRPPARAEAAVPRRSCPGSVTTAMEASTSAPVSRNRRGAGEQPGQPAGEGSGGDVAVDDVFRAVDDRAGTSEVAAGPVAICEVPADSPGAGGCGALDMNKF